MQPRRLVTLLLTVLIAIAPATLSAADTDLIVLANGNRLNGEVKGLEHGQLELSTTAMSTIYIEWNHVAEVTTLATFEVETDIGERYLGRVTSGGPGRLVVEGGGANGNVELDLSSVVRLRPIHARFWERLDGSLAIGSSYTHSSGVGQGTINADVRFRRPGFELESSLDTALTVQTEGEDETSSRASLTFGYARLLRNRWLIPGIAHFENNSDLGLDLRATFGGGLGRFLIQSNRAEMIAEAGLVASKEQPLEGEATKSIEAMLMLAHSFYTYDTPKTIFTLRLLAYPSLSDFGRVRMNLDTTAKREIVSDFTIGVSLYDTYDSRPPTEGASKNDYGVSLSIGWSF